MLIDSGSELSFISESTVHYLNLSRHHLAISIIGIGPANSGNTRGMVSITLKSIYSPQSILLNAYVLPKLSSTISTADLPSPNWPHLQNIQLADPDYSILMKIYLLLGADVYSQIIQSDIIKGSSLTQMAQLTIFGWVILGLTYINSNKEYLSHHLIVDQHRDDLQNLLTKFGIQKDLPNKEKDKLTIQELECEEHFNATYSRDSLGRYIVRLPLSTSPSQLGDSYFKAQRCLQRLLIRFLSQEKYKKLYFSFLEKRANDFHMVKAPPRDNSLTTYYFPYHGILREQSTTTSLRVVFNGSSPSTTCASFNSISHTGAKLQKDISDVLLWKTSYQLTTVTYGTKSASFLAVRVLLQLIQDEGHRFPLAVPVLLNNRYVDDIYGGADELIQLKNIAKELMELLISGKGSTNHSHLIDHTQTKVLGLSWFPRSDQFKFLTETTTPLDQGKSKRSILSEVSQLFDPLGFLFPVIIRAKMLLQELWLNKLGWDDPLNFRKSQFHFDFYNGTSRILGIISIGSSIHVNRLIGSSHLDQQPSRWKEYVRNRVSSIHDLVPQGQWFIRGIENPADCASSGLSAQQFSQHQLWWNSPSWLKNSKEKWLTPTLKSDSSAQVEERPETTLTVTISHHASLDLIEKCSSFYKLLKITAICFRFIGVLIRIPNSPLVHPIGPKDLALARIAWVKITQAAYFQTDIRNLNQGISFSRSHAFSKLNPFIDQQGIFRVRGRLKNSSLDFDNKHPAILPKDSPFTWFIIEEAHLRTFQGGKQLTLAHIRESYWIIGGRLPVRSFILKCVPCARQRGSRAQQLMGQLPLERVSPARPFLTTGVDYAGQITLKIWKGRRAKIKKGWICVFVCFSSSALHLEIFSDYTSEGFLAAYRQFVSRRGICQTLYSDCGTNFIGADQVLKRLFKGAFQDSKELAQLLTKDGTLWKFNPPAAPHMVPSSRLTRWKLIQQQFQSFWSRWSTGYLQQQLAISKWHHPSHEIKVGSMVLLTDERFPPLKWPLARVTELHPVEDGLTRVVSIKTATSLLKRPISKLEVLPVSVE
ncbi:uncharacterized protein LOC122506410 [Leptopilina heterotoma]|uniref:uncharacterized protein LOC122506410 n=1 Tax=Leptopilina heterotoma TaxID=63436 RepID=UPI001CAA04A4|nr:uncharacterized protein LOC122506410 [Leptopilina heterotoma]